MNMRNVLIGISCLVFLAGPPVWAREPAAAVTSKMVDAGNKFCPVSGDKVSGKHFVEHQGKRYGLCCRMCEKKFKKNPEKYSAQMKLRESGKPGPEHHHEGMHHEHSE